MKKTGGGDRRDLLVMDHRPLREHRERPDLAVVDQPRHSRQRIDDDGHLARENRLDGRRTTLVGDGNDVEAVYRAASRAVERARVGGGPTLTMPSVPLAQPNLVNNNLANLLGSPVSALTVPPVAPSSSSFLIDNFLGSVPVSSAPSMTVAVLYDEI